MFEGFLDFIDPSRTKGHINSALQKAGVPDDETEKCLRWAFGDGWDTCLIMTWCDRWNELHPDLFMMYGSDVIQRSLEMVGEEYVKMRGDNGIQTVEEV